MSPRATAPAATLAVIFTVLVAGCATVGQERKDQAMRPFPEARQRVEAFVEETMTRAAPGRRAVPTKLDGHLDDCKDKYGRGDVQASWSYGRRVQPVDDALGDAITAQTEAFWRAQGLEVRADDSIRGVSIRYGAAPDDFNYILIVNRNGGFADFEGSTPCYPYSELPPRRP